MPFTPTRFLPALILLFANGHLLQAQTAISSAIDQARLLDKPPAPVVPAVDSNGNAVASTTDSTDDSFGAQVILKDQERVPSFTLSAGGGLFYTSNAALTRRNTTDDYFAAINAVGVWSHRVNPELEMQVIAQASAFRYESLSQLDFNDLGAGVGLSWTPPRWRGVSAFARYDFTELQSRSGNQILSDHEFTLGAQKFFALGRSHALNFGVLGSLGISTPFVAQRDLLGIFGGYHLQLTRSISMDLVYRISGQLYTSGSRADLNQIVAWSLTYQITKWAEANLNFSFGDNRSNESVFDYAAFSTGVGIGFTQRF